MRKSYICVLKSYSPVYAEKSQHLSQNHRETSRERYILHRISLKPNRLEGGESVKHTSERLQ